jgi:hypothetical protein
VVGANDHVGISTILEEMDSTAQGATVDRGQERGHAIAIGKVGVGAEEQQEANALDVAVHGGFPKREVLSASVGRNTTVEELLDELVVLASDGREKSSLEVGGIRASDAAGVPARHAHGVGLEADDLVRVEVETSNLFERDVGFRCARVGSRLRSSLMRLIESAHAIKSGSGA